MVFRLVDELITALRKVAFSGSESFESQLPGVLDDFILRSTKDPVLLERRQRDRKCQWFVHTI